jgi:hypothetical protein
MKPLSILLVALFPLFVSVFREASEKLRRGDRNAPFPTGSFPPALPFVASPRPLPHLQPVLTVAVDPLHLLDA